MIWEDLFNIGLQFQLQFQQFKNEYIHVLYKHIKVTTVTTTMVRLRTILKTWRKSLRIRWPEIALPLCALAVNKNYFGLQWTWIFHMSSSTFEHNMFRSWFWKFTEIFLTFQFIEKNCLHYEISNTAAKARMSLWCLFYYRFSNTSITLLLHYRDSPSLPGYIGYRNVLLFIHQHPTN